MFHVERVNRTVAVIALAMILLLFAGAGCGVSRNRATIDDFTILSNGKSVPGQPALHAFVFESFQPRLTFTGFLAHKFKTEYLPDGIWVEEQGHRYKIMVYDNSELEKYFVVADFIITELKPLDEYNAGQPHFTAISAIDTNNNDCLAEGSLLYNIVTTHLKSLKDEYNKLR